MGGDTEPVAPRSTASQMQRGSGELQSTPTGFWKLQSDPAGAGHGSIAAGIEAWSFLRSTSLTAHMGCSQAHTQGRGRSPDAKISNTQSSPEKTGGFHGAYESSSEVLQSFKSPVSLLKSMLSVPSLQKVQSHKFHITELSSRSPGSSPPRLSHTHLNTLSGA